MMPCSLRSVNAINCATAKVPGYKTDFTPSKFMELLKNG